MGAVQGAGIGLAPLAGAAVRIGAMTGAMWVWLLVALQDHDLPGPAARSALPRWCGNRWPRAMR